MNHRKSILNLGLLLCAAIFLVLTAAFTTTTSPAAIFSQTKTARTRHNHPTKLSAGLFGGLFGGNTQQSNAPTTVLSIPAKDVKIGALRFFLQIYLVGECNKPAPKSWFAKQNENGGIDMYFNDATGMCSIDMTEYAINVKRHGQKPSLQYMLQESVLLHGLLDELNTLAFGVDDIKEEKRLLRLNDPEALEKARESLPAKKAKDE